MLALTIWQPWASAIALGHKLVENRDWPPPPALLGQLIAIHAAKREPDIEDFVTVCRRLGLPTMHCRPRTPGGIELMKRIDASFGKVIGVARVVDVVESAANLPHEQRRWFVGRYGWVLGDVQLLDQPVPCRGLQKLWTLPDDVEQLVQAQRRVTR